MDFLIYIAVRTVWGVLGCLPVRLVVVVARVLGGLGLRTTVGAVWESWSNRGVFHGMVTACGWPRTSCPRDKSPSLNMKKGQMAVIHSIHSGYYDYELRTTRDQ